MTQFFLLHENIPNIAMYQKTVCDIINTSTSVELIIIPPVQDNQLICL